MATTTNYSWTTPDDTDLVKDGASAIRTLGSAIDTTVFTNAGAAIQKSIVDAAGDLIYATADDTPARLAIGTAGQVLQVNSGATAPEWAAPAGGGKVLQVVSATTTTSTVITSTTLTDTTLTASITPSAATSKILVITNQNTQINRNIFSADARLRLMRDSTTIYDQTASEGAFWIYTDGSGTTNTIGIQMINLVFLDTPNTTSSITYKTQGAVSTTSNSNTLTFQAVNRPSSITLLEIGA